MSLEATIKENTAAVLALTAAYLAAGQAKPAAVAGTSTAPKTPTKAADKVPTPAVVADKVPTPTSAAVEGTLTYADVQKIGMGFARILPVVDEDGKRTNVGGLAQARAVIEPFGLVNLSDIAPRKAGKTSEGVEFEARGEPSQELLAKIKAAFIAAGAMP